MTTVTDPHGGSIITCILLAYAKLSDAVGGSRIFANKCFYVHVQTEYLQSGNSENNVFVAKHSQQIVNMLAMLPLAGYDGQRKLPGLQQVVIRHLVPSLYVHESPPALLPDALQCQQIS